MNHIYRVVFNKATGTFMAVAEYARAQGKGSSTVGSSSADKPSTSGQLLRLSLVSSALLMAAQAQAATGTDVPVPPGVSAVGGSNIYYCFYHHDADTVICGDGATSSGNNNVNGVVLGKTAQMTGNSAIAIGNGTHSTLNAVSIGRDAKATNNNDIAIGRNAGRGLNDKGSNFNGTGKVSYVAGSTLTVGKPGDVESIATGTNISVGDSAGENATGVRNINVGKSAGKNHFGEDSVTIGTDANNFTKAKNVDGSNLALGDTFRARRTVAIGNTAMTYGKQSIAIGNGANTKQVSYNNGANYTTAENAIAVGSQARAAGNNAIAQGTSSVAQGINDIVIGLNAKAEIDPTKDRARVSGIAIGNNAYIGHQTGSNAIAIGSNARVIHGGNNKMAIGPNAISAGTISSAVGVNAIARGDTTSAYGSYTQTSAGFDSAAVGASSTTGLSGNNMVAVGVGAITNNKAATAIGSGNMSFGVNSTVIGATGGGNTARMEHALQDTNMNDTNFSIVGGQRNTAIGNANLIGSSSHDNFVLGNQVKIGASSATVAKTTQTITGTDGNVDLKIYTPTFNNTKSVNRSVAIGQGASVADNDTIAMGTGAVAGDAAKAASATANAIAIGNGTQATHEAAVAVGALAQAAGERSAALSAYSKALGSHDIAIGDQSVASGTYSVAIGSTSKASELSATALGDSTTANVANSVALGAYSTTIAAKGTTTDGNGIVSDATVGGITYSGTSFAGRNAQTLGVVSVGKVGEERRIQNVAAGLISATSTDAINGSQLYAVASTLGEQVENTYFHVNNGSNTGTGNTTTNLGKITDAAGATGAGAVTAGVNATANTLNSIAIGRDATVQAVNGVASTSAIAIGHAANIAADNADRAIAIGNNAKVLDNAEGSVVVGDKAQANGQSTVALGESASTEGLRSVAIGTEAQATNTYAVALGQNAQATAVNAMALGSSAYANAQNAVAVGPSSQATASLASAFGSNAAAGATQATALGSNATASGAASTAVGRTAVSSATNSTAVGARANASIANSVALGADAVTTAKGTTTNGIGAVTDPVTVNGVSYGDFAGKTSVGVVSVGAVGTERRIQNVAAGLISATSTDAINGSQLYLVTQGTLDQMPVVYTDTDGNKVVKQPDGTFINPKTNEVVAPENVIASMNNPNGETNDAPMILANVGSALTTTPTTINPTGTDQRAEEPILNIPADGSKDDNAATVGDLRNMGWVVSAKGNDYSDVVRNANEVRFVGTGLATVTGETVDNIRTITVDVNAQSTVEAAQLPVVYTNKDGDKLIKVGDKFYPAGSVVSPNGDVYPAGTVLSNTGAPTDPSIEPIDPTETGDVIASMNDGSNSTTAPMTLTNIEGNLDGAKTDTTAPTTVGTAANVADISNNAATVGDVLNAGWNLKHSTGGATPTVTEKDFVRAFDNVVFANGEGTTASVEVTDEGKTSTIKYDVKVDNNTIKVNNDGQLYADVTDTNTVTSLIDGNYITATNTGTADAPVYKVDVNTGNITNNDDGKAVAPATNAIATVQNVADAINNSAWKLDVSQSEGEAVGTGEELINPSDKVTIDAGKNISITQAGSTISIATAKDVEFDSVKTNSLEIPTDNGSSVKIDNNGVDVGGNVISNVADGDKDGDAVNVSQLKRGRTTVTSSDNSISVVDTNNGAGDNFAYDIKINSQAVVDNAQLPVVYTNKDGNKVYKQVDPNTGNVTYNTAPDGTGTVVQPADVIASMNNGDNSTTNPMTLTNIEGNLDGAKTGTTAPTTVGAVPNDVNANNAATVGDVLNAGWNLQGNSEAKDFVKSFDTVNFVNGKGTTASVETTADGKTSTIKYDVNVDGDTITTKTDPNDPTKTVITANTTSLTNTDGKVNTPVAPTALVTAQTVANAINNSGWKLAAEGTEGTELISPSDTATFKVGSSNLTVKRENSDITYDLAKDINVNSVQFNENGPKITNDGDNIKVGDKDGKPTKIANVADGDISPVSTDVINGKQLNNYAKVNGQNVNTTPDGSINIVNGKGTTVSTNQEGEIAVNIGETGLTVSNGSQTNADGSVAADGTLVVQDPNGSGANFVNATNLAKAVNNVSWKVDSEKDETTANAATKNTYTADNNKVKAGDTVKVNAGRNVEISGSGKNINVAVSDNPEFDTVKVGKGDNATTISSNQEGLRVAKADGSAQRITNVRAGVADTDAVNVSQLKGAVNHLDNKINRNNRNLRAGIAGANAAAGLPQVYIPGKSMVAASAGTFKGESALAVGYSRASDNGKVILKLQGNANTRGDVGASVGVGYQW